MFEQLRWIILLLLIKEDACLSVVRLEREPTLYSMYCNVRQLYSQLMDGIM